MARTSTIEINGQALKDAIHKRGLTLTGVADALGRSHSYFDQQCRGGYTTRATALTLDTLYGISPEEYVVVRETEEERATREEEEDKAEDMKKTIYNAVYLGVYQAVTDALKASETIDNLCERLGAVADKMEDFVEVLK